MDNRLIALLVVIAIIAVIGFMTKWTFRFRRSTYDGEDEISEEELEKIEKQLEAELTNGEGEGYEMYEDSDDEDSDEEGEGEEFVE